MGNEVYFGEVDAMRFQRLEDCVYRIEALLEKLVVNTAPVINANAISKDLLGLAAEEEKRLRDTLYRAVVNCGGRADELLVAALVRVCKEYKIGRLWPR